MMITETTAAGQLAAIDQAAMAYQDACRAFAGMTGTYEQVREAETQLRHAGHDPATGLITLPVAAVRFTDERADGARMTAVCGSVLGGEIWVAWSGRSLRHGGESRTYDAYDLIKIKAR